MSRSETLPLTPLRFIAAAFVVLQHYGPAVNVVPPALTGLGMSAVSFFFVLSGFILTYCYRDATSENGMIADTRSFYVTRLARLAPVYWLSLAVAAPLYLVSFWRVHEIDARTFATGLVLVPIMMQAWVTPAALLWNAPAWSLSVEFFFYALFPAIMRLARRAGVVALLLASLLMLYGFKIALVRRGQYLPASMPPDMQMKLTAYLPLLRLPQFLLGIALALAFERYGKLRPMLHAAIAALSLAALFCDAKTGILGSVFSSTIVFGGLIYGVAGLEGRPANVLRARTPVLLGEASYALYLLHWPLAIYWLNTHVRDKIVHISPWLDLACYSTLAIAVSILCYLLFERPARQKIIATLNRNQPVFKKAEPVEATA